MNKQLAIGISLMLLGIASILILSSAINFALYQLFAVPVEEQTHHWQLTGTSVGLIQFVNYFMVFTGFLLVIFSSGRE